MMRMQLRVVSSSLVVLMAGCSYSSSDGDLGSQRQPAASQGLVDRLGAELDSGDAIARLRAAVSLYELGKEADAVSEKVIAAARSSDAGTRVAAIAALGAIGGAANSAFLAELVSSEGSDPLDRASAARALAHLNAKEQLSALESALAGSRDRLVQAQALEAIVTIDGAAAKAIASRYLRSTDPILCTHAASLLAETNSSARQILIEATRSSDATVRSTALSAAVARIIARQLTAASLPISVSADSPVGERIAGHFIQAAQGNPAGAEGLKAISAGEEPVAFQAAAALGQLFAIPAGEAARDEFISSLVNGSELALSRTAAATAMSARKAASSGGSSAVMYDALARNLDATLNTSEDTDTRVLAIRTLGFMTTDIARDALKNALAREKDPGVSLAIQTALARQG